MGSLLCFLLVLSLATLTYGSPEPSIDFNYQNVNDEVNQQPFDLMSSKNAHLKDTPLSGPAQDKSGMPAWAPYDFTKFETYFNTHKDAASEHNRIKRRAKHRRGRNGRRRNKNPTLAPVPDDAEKNSSTTENPSGRRYDTDVDQRQKSGRKSKKAKKKKYNYDTYEPPIKEWESSFVEMPKDLYQAHLRPGVIFRIHMAEAILKMQYRNYGEDKDESVIEADVEYLRLTRKVINDEITKFEDLIWLVGWFNNRSDLIKEHTCNNRYYAVGTPPTMFTHTEEYMKRLCLFDSVFIDHMPYVIGEDSSLMAAVAPPVLHCDAATCTSVPFIDRMTVTFDELWTGLMFDERLSRTNVRTVTRCQASCRAHCRNDPDCLKRCSDRCLRAD